MSQPKKNVLSFEQKFQQRVLVVRLAVSQGTQAAVLRSGVPERSVRRWKEKFERLGVEGLRELSRAAKVVANKKDLDGSLGRALTLLNTTEPGLTRIQVLAKLMFEPSTDAVALSWIARTRNRLGLTRVCRKTSSLDTPAKGSLDQIFWCLGSKRKKSRINCT